MIYLPPNNCQKILTRTKINVVPTYYIDIYKTTPPPYKSDKEQTKIERYDEPNLSKSEHSQAYLRHAFVDVTPLSSQLETFKLA